MTGEMIKADVTAEAYPLHFAIAKAPRGSVEPFDVYQGPYVVIGNDIRCGQQPYAFAPRGLGVVRLWLCSDDGAFATIYNEANEKQSEAFPLYCDDMSEVLAVEMAESVLD